MGKYAYTNRCREISGFGGGYEDTCREMVIRGMEWFDKYPQANPALHEYKNVYGIVVPDNPDAESLVNYMSEGTDCTGAMVQACVSHCMYAAKNGWDKYIAEMEKMGDEEKKRN